MSGRFMRALAFGVIAGGGLLLASPKPARADTDCSWCVTLGLASSSDTICSCGTDPIYYCITAKPTCPAS